MRVFVCEYVTGGGFHTGPPPSGLQREGDLMVSALVNDLAEIPGVRVTAARDGRLPVPDLQARFVAPPAGRDPWPCWSRCVDEADAVWPIAPETDGILERLSRLVLSRGRVLLGCSPEAVALSASKRATVRELERCGVPVVPVFPVDGAPGDEPDGWVLKPDDGAGSDHTFRLSSASDVTRFVAAERHNRFILQPFAAGAAASLSMLCRDGEARLLTCNRQTISLDGARFRYGGGTVAGLEARRAAYEPIAAAVAQAIPGLWGYVGVDLIDGIGGPRVLEINPRLTTSYVALREAIGLNPAQLVLDLLEVLPHKLPEVVAVRSVSIDLGGGVG